MSDIKLDINIRDGLRLEAVCEDDCFVMASEGMWQVFDAKVEEALYCGRREDVRRFAAELITLGERYMKRVDGQR